MSDAQVSWVGDIGRVDSLKLEKFLELNTVFFVDLNAFLCKLMREWNEGVPRRPSPNMIEHVAEVDGFRLHISGNDLSLVGYCQYLLWKDGEQIWAMQHAVGSIDRLGDGEAYWEPLRAFYRAAHPIVYREAFLANDCYESSGYRFVREYKGSLASFTARERIYVSRDGEWVEALRAEARGGMTVRID